MVCYKLSRAALRPQVWNSEDRKVNLLKSFILILLRGGRPSLHPLLSFLLFPLNPFHVLANFRFLASDPTRLRPRVNYMYLLASARTCHDSLRLKPFSSPCRNHFYFAIFRVLPVSLTLTSRLNLRTVPGTVYARSSYRQLSQHHAPPVP